MPSVLHLVFSAALLAALVGLGLGLARMHALGAAQRAAGGERWWYSSTVDLVSLAGLLLAAAAHRALGLPGPQALLSAFGSCLLIYVAEYLMSRRGVTGGSRVLAFVVCAVIGALPALLAPGWLSRALRALDRALYGG